MENGKLFRTTLIVFVHLDLGTDRTDIPSSHVEDADKQTYQCFDG